MRMWLGLVNEDANAIEEDLRNIDGVMYSVSRDMYMTTNKVFEKVINMFPELDDYAYNDENAAEFIEQWFEFEIINHFGEAYDITMVSYETIENFAEDYVNEETGVISCEEDFAVYIDSFIKTTIACYMQIDLEKLLFKLTKEGYDISILQQAFCRDYARMLKEKGEYIG